MPTRDHTDGISAPTSPGAALSSYLTAGPTALLTAVGTAEPTSAPTGLLAIVGAWMARHTLHTAGGGLPELPPGADAQVEALLLVAQHLLQPGGTAPLRGARARFAEAGDLRAQGFVSWLLSAHLLETGDLEEAEHAVAHCREHADREGFAPLLALALDAEARLDLLRNLPAAALELHTEALELCQGGGISLLGWIRSGRAAVLRASGRPVDAAEQLSAGVRAFRRAGDLLQASLGACRLTQLWMAAGQPARALASLRALPAGRLPTHYAAQHHRALADVHAALGRFGEARRQYARSLELLPPGSTHAAETRARDLAAAHVLGVAPVGGLPDEHGPALALKVAQRAFLGEGPSPAALGSRALARGDRSMACALSGLEAREAQTAGRPEVAARALDRAERLALESGSALRRHRTARQRASHLVRYQPRESTTARRMLEALVDEAQLAGDVYGEARARGWLARARCSGDLAGARAQASIAANLAAVHGHQPLLREVAPLARILGARDVPDPAPISAELSLDVRTLEAISRLCHADEPGREAAALSEIDVLLGRLPAPNRAHLQALTDLALDATGLRLEVEGHRPGLVFDHGTKEVWHQGLRVITLKRSALLFRLLFAIATRGPDLNREGLFEAVWETPYRPPSSDNTLYVNIRRLRSKLEEGPLAIDAGPDGSYAVAGGPAVWSRGGSDPSPAGADLDVEPSDAPSGPDQARPPPQAPRGSTPVDTLAHPARTERARGTNLAPLATPLVGRESELEALQASLARGARLVTLTGAPGVGKTHLLTQLGSTLLGEYADRGGVWRCDLAGSRSLDELLQAVADTLGVPLAGTDPTQHSAQLGQAIASRGPCLLLLDTFEHLVDLGPASIGRWLRVAREARFVLGSRQRMDVPGEQVLHLDPLEPEPAITLFVQCAQAVRPTFDPVGLIPELRQVVARLDCVPLAIALAAAQMHVLGPRALLERLDQRFQILDSGRPGRDARASTLEGAIAWSWDLLAPWERGALAQCAVFQGGFSLEAAEAVIDLSPYGDAPWTFDVVRALRDKSLLRTFELPALPGELRFDMLASIRDFVEARRGEAPSDTALAQRHAAWFLGQGNVWAAHEVRGPRQREYWARMMAERDNLLRVAANLLPTQPDRSADALFLLRRGFQNTGPLQDYIIHLDGVLEHSSHLSPPQRIRLLLARAGTRAFAGELAPAQEDAEAALAQAAGVDPDGGLRARALLILGRTFFQQGQHLDAAVHHLEGALAIYQRLDAPILRGDVLLLLGNAASYVGDHAEALCRYEAALACYRPQENLRGEAAVLTNRAQIHRWAGRLDAALADQRRALTLARDGEDLGLAAYATTQVGALHLELGHVSEARTFLLRALDVQQRYGRPELEAGTRIHLGRLAHGVGDLQQSIAEFEYVLGPLGTRLRLMADVPPRLGLAAVRQELGELEAARALCSEALERARSTADRRGTARALGALAAVLADLGELDPARAHMAEAEAMAAGAGDSSIQRTLGVQHGHIDLAEGEMDAVLQRIRAVSEPAEETGSPPGAGSQDLRLAVRVLKAARGR